MANALITGTHRGIGRSILLKFAQNGYNAWACARRPDPAFEEEIADIARKNNVWIEPVYFDLSSTESIKAGFRQVWLSKKPVDVLVNCAGVAFVDLFQRTPEQKIREVFLALFVLWDAAKDILEPGPFVHAVSLAGGKQGVHHGSSLGCLIIAAEQVVLAADGQGPDAVLYHVIVYLVSAVGNVETEFLKDSVGI